MQPDQNQYDFIFNDPNKKAKKSFLPRGSKNQWIIFVAIGASILIVLALIVAAIFSSAGKGSTEALVSVAKQQTEVIRIADIGVDKATGSEARNLAITTKLSLTTSQKQVIAAIQKGGRKLSNQELAGALNPKTDTLLTSAEQAGKFDEVFLETLKTQLTAYQNELRQAQSAVSSKANKEILANAIKQVTLLLDSQ